MDNWQPDAQLLDELINLHIQSQAKEKEFIEACIPKIEDILSREEYRLNSRKRGLYARATAYSLFRSFMKQQEWHSNLPEKYIADQILIRKIINGDRDSDLHNRHIRFIANYLCKQENGYNSLAYEERARDIWQACLESIVKRKFVLEASFKSYVKAVARNTLTNEWKKDKSYREYANEMRSEAKTESYSEYEVEEEIVNPLVERLNKLDVAIIRNFQTLTEQCRQFIYNRYSVDELFQKEFESIREYGPEYRAFFEEMYETGIKVNSIKRAAELLGLKPVSANKYAQTCLDSLVLKTYGQMEEILSTPLGQYTRYLNIIMEKLKKRYRDASNRYQKHLKKNRDSKRRIAHALR